MIDILVKNEIIVLLWLQENTEGNIRELVQGTGLSQIAIYNNTNILEKKDLIRMTLGSNRAKIFSLTDLGKQVAEKCRVFVNEVSSLLETQS